MNDYSFNPLVACKFGVDEAIMIHNFKWWINKNIANGKHQHDGRTWTYNSNKAFQSLFPFWSKGQVERIVKSLTDQGILLKGNYNDHTYDRTLWFAFNDEEMLSQNNPFLLSGNGDLDNKKPIPDSKPVSKLSSKEDTGQNFANAKIDLELDHDNLDDNENINHKTKVASVDAVASPSLRDRLTKLRRLPKKKEVAPTKIKATSKKNNVEQIVPRRIPTPKKLSREEIQLVNKTKAHIVHWNGKVEQANIKSKELRKHNVDPNKGGKTFCFIKGQIQRLCDDGATSDSINAKVDLYFDFLVQKYKHKKFTGLHVGFNDFLFFSRNLDQRLADTKSPLMGEKSWFDIILHSGETKTHVLQTLSERFGGASMKDNNPGFTKVFIKNFIKFTGRKRLTDKEKGDFVRVSELFAKFCDKHKKHLSLPSTSFGSPISLISIAFDLKKQNVDMKSFWFKSPSFWDTDFKYALKDRCYLTN